jgi:hypothetical protein
LNHKRAKGEAQGDVVECERLRTSWGGESCAGDRDLDRRRHGIVAKSSWYFNAFYSLLCSDFCHQVVLFIYSENEVALNCFADKHE